MIMAEIPLSLASSWAGLCHVTASSWARRRRQRR